MIPNLAPVYHVRDYAPALNFALLAEANTERLAGDRFKAAEERKKFEHSVREVKAGLEALMQDIRTKGILEENLASVRRTISEDFMTTQATYEFTLRQLVALDAQSGSSFLRSKAGKDLKRDLDRIKSEVKSLRDTIAIAVEGYSAFLNELATITPIRLSPEDYATVRKLDAILPELERMQASLDTELMVDIEAQNRRRMDDEFYGRRAYGLLGALLVGLLALYLSGPLGSLVGSAAGAYLGANLFRRRSLPA